jgi:hypothetical protein
MDSGSPYAVRWMDFVSMTPDYKLKLDLQGAYIVFQTDGVLTYLYHMEKDDLYHVTNPHSFTSTMLILKSHPAYYALMKALSELTI